MNWGRRSESSSFKEVRGLLLLPFLVAYIEFLLEGVPARINEPYSGKTGLVGYIHPDKDLRNERKYLALGKYLPSILAPFILFV